MAEPLGPPNPAADRSTTAAPPDEPMSRPARRALQLADRLPDWLGSIRFRLTALYSLLLFALAAFMVAGLYAVLATRLHDETLYRTYQVTTVEQVPGGVVLTPTEVRARYRSVEALANERALSLLRAYSLSALGLLFVASLAIGWLVAGRVLGPIGRITAVARDIQATDLSRRIALRGPPDELKQLADTFDAMLTRLDDAFAGQQRFIQEASHELRNPLAVMRTNIEVALADPDADPAELRRVAELAGASAARMSRLVDDLLVYARLGARHESVPVPARPAGRRRGRGVPVGRLAARHRARERHRGCAHRAGRPPRAARPSPTCWANATRLARGQPHLARRRDRGGVGGRLGDRRGPRHRGRGPAPRVRAPARDKQAARAEGRSGLGLAIVAQILADHGGVAEVAPNVAGGTVFTLRLPLDGDAQRIPS
ncbi:MAG: histidine kinase dimerization/phospho-acceptor domain-containing protein [Acidimicrobiales bacterium]